jgi:hypothetical protein
MAKQPKRLNPKKNPVTPFPMPKMPKLIGTSAKLAAYQEAAAKLEFKPVELLCAELLDFFVKEGIMLRNYKEVDAWLGVKKLREEATHWCWRPLRPKDVITEFSWGRSRRGWDWTDGFYCQPNLNAQWRGDYEAIHACRSYQRLIPRVALEHVDRIERAFPDEVKFFVSDFATIIPDPFIMVRPARRGDRHFRHETFIFGVWFEPGFGRT